MDIYSVLASKPHNPHYLNRYITFIQRCQQHNIFYEGRTERHHICPKAKDMFPEYKNFQLHKWNCCILTPRQHFIAHLLLWKSFPNIHSCVNAVWFMKNYRKSFVNSRVYETLKTNFVDLQRKRMEKFNHKKVENGTHNFLGDSNPSRKRVKEGTHHFLGGEQQRKRVEDGTHNFLDSEMQRENAAKRVKDGTHNFLGGKIQKKTNLKRIEEGTHHLLGGKQQRKRVEDGEHHLLGGEVQRKSALKMLKEKRHNFSKVYCIDKEGNMISVDRTVYNDTQTLEFGLAATDKTYVHVTSKEARIRKQNCSA